MSGGDGSAVAIPAGTKKMVQSLKEIVDCTEQEIYATLKDCGMDPNEAVNRLILQVRCKLRKIGSFNGYNFLSMVFANYGAPSLLSRKLSGVRY